METLSTQYKNPGPFCPEVKWNHRVAIVINTLFSQKENCLWVEK